MVSAASFVVFSKKSYRQEVRIIVRVKGIRVLLDPRQSRRLSEKKQEKRGVVLGISPLVRLRAPVQAFQLVDGDEVATRSCT
jgi:hypothetical protein